MTDVDSFLSRRPSRPCPVCAVPEMVSAIKRFLDRKQEGTTAVSLHYFHQKFILAQWENAPKSLNTVARHIRRCLERDHLTGESLEA